MATPYVDDDADLSLVQDRNVAVLGYGGQARAQALCLRDSGVDVRVGLERGTAPWEDAEADGVRVVTAYEACEEADLLVLPDLEGADPIAREVVLPNLVEGDAVVLGATAVLGLEPVPGVDVVRVMPWVSGAAVREEFSQGRGAPMFASVVVDASGAGWDLVLAYARAIGGTRAGVVRTTDEEFARARGFARDTLFNGEVLPLLRSGFDRLVASGCQPEVAYLHCLHGLAAFGVEVGEGGLDARLAATRSAPSGGAEPDPLPAAAALVRSLMSGQRASSAGLD